MNLNYKHIYRDFFLYRCFCILKSVFVSQSLGNVNQTLCLWYFSYFFIFYFFTKCNKIQRKNNHQLYHFITNCFTCTRFFFSSSVLLQCAEFFFFGFVVVMETSFSTTLDSNRGFGFDQHINVLETFEMKMFILRLYHNYLCKVFI